MNQSEMHAFLDAKACEPFCTSDELRAVLRLRDVGAIPSLLSYVDSLQYARKHGMIAPLIARATAPAAPGQRQDDTPMPNARRVPGGVKGDGEWVVEALADVLNDLLPKLATLAYRAELAGEDEAAELAGALFYTARVGCDNLEIIIEDAGDDH